MLKNKRIAVIGMGYVGIPAAVLLADAGYNVTGIQRRSSRSGWKIDWLNQGKCPIGGNEPELPQMLQRVVQEGRFVVTDNYSALSDADIVLIDVQTPTDEAHVPKYESLSEASRQVGKYLRPGNLVVIESTVAPGTTEHVVKPILQEVSGLCAGLPEGFGLCFSYERVMVGRLIHNIREYPKIVGSLDDESKHMAMEMYRSIVRAEVHGTDIMTAEVSKTVENAYRDVQIAFANEVGLLCESLGIDVHEVRKLVNGLPNDPSAPGGWRGWSLSAKRHLASHARVQHVRGIKAPIPDVSPDNSQTLERLDADPHGGSVGGGTGRIREGHQRIAHLRAGLCISGELR
jgi:UDP-N-acetyl-D-mannosaminuronic acid dehydrogenase